MVYIVLIAIVWIALSFVLRKKRFLSLEEIPSRQIILMLSTIYTLWALAVYWILEIESIETFLWDTNNEVSYYTNVSYLEEWTKLLITFLSFFTFAYLIKIIPRNKKIEAFLLVMFMSYFSFYLAENIIYIWWFKESKDIIMTWDWWTEKYSEAAFKLEANSLQTQEEQLSKAILMYHLLSVLRTFIPFTSHLLSFIIMFSIFMYFRSKWSSVNPAIFILSFIFSLAIWILYHTIYNVQLVNNFPLLLLSTAFVYYIFNESFNKYSVSTNFIVRKI